MVGGIETGRLHIRYGTEILTLTNQDHKRLCCNCEVPGQLNLIKCFVLVSRICIVGTVTVQYVRTGYVQQA
jgi:hypothetical protein